jgi:hypothetical protein
MVLIPELKTSPKLDPRKLRWLIYGEPKVGKTPLAAGFDEPLFLVTEKSTEALSIYKADIQKWEDFRDAVTEILKGKHKFKTVVIDVVDELYRYCINYVNSRLKIEHLSDAGFAKAYHFVDNEFDHWLNKLCMADIGIIFTSHLEEKEVRKKNEPSIYKLVPSLMNRGRNILEPKMTIITHLKWEKIRKTTTTKLEYDEKLVLLFRQTEALFVGDRTGKMPDKLILHTIPEGSPKGPEVMEEYAKKNFKLIESYFLEGGNETSEVKVDTDNKTEETKPTTTN